MNSIINLKAMRIIARVIIHGVNKRLLKSIQLTIAKQNGSLQLNHLKIFKNLF